MRRKTHSRIKDDHTALLFALFILLFSNIFIASNTVAAQEEQLFIDAIDEISENEDFFVSVYTLNETGVPAYQIDVEIEFDGNLDSITDEHENREITLIAPEVSEDTIYTIKASKNGYAPAEKNITVLNQQRLLITLDKYTVKANERFSVVVTDENKNPVKDATVYIQSVLDESGTTNNDGRTWLNAPEDRTDITIIARKEGYQDGTTTMEIDTPPSWWELLLKNPYIPIVAAVILLILAIVFVNLRQRKHVDTRAKEISKEQVLKRYSSHGAVVSSQPNGSRENINMDSKRGPKVEEIRISRPRKDKEIVPVETEKEEVKKVIPRKVRRRHEYDWFEGTADVRYEIDKITGEIDEEGVDRWFEGIDDIRAKIDEKVKKKDKKKGK